MVCVIQVKYHGGRDLFNYFFVRQECLPERRMGTWVLHGYLQGSVSMGTGTLEAVCIHKGEVVAHYLGGEQNPSLRASACNVPSHIMFMRGISYGIRVLSIDC